MFSDLIISDKVNFRHKKRETILLTFIVYANWILILTINPFPCKKIVCVVNIVNYIS